MAQSAAWRVAAAWRGAAAWRVAALAVAALAVAAALLAGCSGGPSARATQAYLALVHQLSPDVGSYAGSTQLIHVGHAVCDDFSSGASAQQVADRVGSAGAGAALPSEDLGSVMRAAVETLCPRYSNVFGSGGPG